MESTKMTHIDNTPTPWPYLYPYNTMPAIHIHIPTLESFLFQFPNIISPSYVTPNIQMSPRFQPIFLVRIFYQDIFQEISRKTFAKSYHGDIETIFDEFTFHNSMFNFLEFDEPGILFFSFILHSLDITGIAIQSGMHRNTEFAGRLVACIHLQSQEMFN